MYYYDTMDNSRLVRPIKKVGNDFECGIYWLQPNDKTHTPTFGGKANVPCSLFDENPRNRYIGFLPWKAPEEVKVVDATPAPDEREEYEERKPRRRVVG